MYAEPLASLVGSTNMYGVTVPLFIYFKPDDVEF